MDQPARHARHPDGRSLIAPTTPPETCLEPIDTFRLLIGKAYAALPAGGALIVYEVLIDDERRRNAVGLLASLNMLIETPGGFASTGAEGCRWLREAGFRDAHVEHLAGPDSMMVGIK